jgi:hypothetical protein
MFERDETNYRPSGQAKENNALSIERQETHQGLAHINLFDQGFQSSLFHMSCVKEAIHARTASEQTRRVNCKS